MEVCDDADLDEDCDGLADDADPTTSGQLSFYGDGDQDGFGSGPARLACEPLPYEVSNDLDCDDTDPAIHPDADEVCDDLDTDENCDGLADDADPTATGQSPAPHDADGDGYAGSDTALYCDPPVLLPGDCDDADPLVNPGAVEVCDAADVDEDCDGLSDDDDDDVTGTQPLLVDADGDGFGDGAAGGEACDPRPGLTLTGGDCNDADPDISPAGQEVCDSLGVDEDCDGLVDDLDPTVIGGSEYPLDLDEDGYAGDTVGLACEPPEVVEGDCDDDDPSRWPGAAEIADDGIDQNCDGSDLVVSYAGGGCGCEATAAGPVAGWWMAGWALAAWARRRRRLTHAYREGIRFRIQ